MKNFFLRDGTPKYYDKKIYPIDIHAPAQLIVTLARLGKIEENKALILSVLSWTVTNMQNLEHGYFYYQLKKGLSSKISYMRWAQAWMFYSYTFYFENFNNEK